MLKPHVRVVIIEVLRLVARAEIEEMTGVMEALLEEFVDDIIPIAVDVATELVTSLFVELERDNFLKNRLKVVSVENYCLFRK